MTRAAFLDLNGTLVMPVQAAHPHEYTVLPMAMEAVRVLNRAGFTCPIVTVQSRIGKGLYSIPDFLSWFSRFRSDLSAEGAAVEGPYLCPHWREDRCACKKPQTLLYREAAHHLGANMANSVVIGDDISDVLAARHLGCVGYLVPTGWGEKSIRERAADLAAHHVAADVLEAAQWVVSGILGGSR
ncbi:MAG: HAD-IIIA family hydrolase [Chloroflexota bacterium]|nr:HAD-IIIA family hydrolase [Chloroflexota bacterium]